MSASQAHIACQAVTHVAQSVSYQFNENLGFITSSPALLGAALKVIVNVKLPHVNTSSKFADVCEKFHIAARAVQDESSDSANVVFEISNKRTLGVTEKEILEDVYQGLIELINLEKAESATVAAQSADPNSSRSRKSSSKDSAYTLAHVHNLQ